MAEHVFNDSCDIAVLVTNERESFITIIEVVVAGSNPVGPI